MNKTIWRIPLKVLNAIPEVKVNMIWYTKEENEQEEKALDEKQDKKYEKWDKNESKYYDGKQCPRCDATESIEKRKRDHVSGDFFLGIGDIKTKTETYYVCHGCKKSWDKKDYKDTSFNNNWDTMKERGFVWVTNMKAKGRWVWCGWWSWHGESKLGV